MYYTVQNGEEDEIIDNLQDLGCLINPKSVVSLEAFFNDPNFLISTISSSTRERKALAPMFYELLKSIRNREDVEAVLVEISGISVWESEGKFMKPITERIYIVTSASKKKVANWVAPLKPDVISKGWFYDLEPWLAQEISEGNEVFALYWGCDHPEQDN